jgi:hypothetical protein
MLRRPPSTDQRLARLITEAEKDEACCAAKRLRRVILNSPVHTRGEFGLASFSGSAQDLLRIWPELPLERNGRDGHSRLCQC